jgi:hypothetical protein
MTTHACRLAVTSVLATAAIVTCAGTPASAEAAAHASSPQVYSGTVVTAAGVPVAGQKVSLYVTPDAVGKSTVIGTAVTGPEGHWSLPAPSYAALPKVAQKAATANMGWLNVDIVAMTGSSTAVAVESAFVGTPGVKTETGSTKPLAMTMRLTAMSGATRPKSGDCCGRFGCEPPFVNKVLGRTHSYTVVGEWHAYWNATGGLSYTRGATSSIGSYISQAGGGFAFNGYDTFSTADSLTMGFAGEGPYSSHQMVISVAYIKRHYIQTPIGGGGVICAQWTQIDEDGLYDPGHGWHLWKPGKNVIRDDGKKSYQYERKHHPSHIDGIFAHGAFSLSRGSALTYGVAASAFGVGIQASTSHSTAVAQQYQAGSSHARSHYVWGNDGNLTQNPQVEYSY